MYSLHEAVDDAHGSIEAHIGRHQGVFHLVEHFVVDAAFAGHGAGELAKQAFFCFLEPLVEVFFLFAVKKLIKKTHVDQVFAGMVFPGCLRAAKVGDFFGKGVSLLTIVGSC